jgi:hypothetical protein
VNFSDSNKSDNPNDQNKFTKPEKVKFLIKSLNSKKSSCFDNISNFLIKKFPDVAIKFLTIIYNNCINNGYFPKYWKIAKLIPLHKKKKNFEVQNFRPISLTPNLGKILEKIISAQIDSYISIDDENIVIGDYQFGFKSQHSTSHAILKFQTDIVQNLRQKKSTVACFLDVEKAFDSVWVKGLLFKLNRIGLPIYLKKILHSFLSDRYLIIWLDNEKSEYVQVLSGVPQGTILGPKLYNLFIHDFPHERISNNNNITSKTILLADDTNTFAHHESPKQALNKIKDHVNEITSYYEKWGINININKSQLICFRNASGKGKRNAVKESKNLKLNIRNTDVLVSNNVKWLGVNFVPLFKFNYHARLALQKSNNAYRCLLPLFYSKSLSSNTKLLMYKALIRPILIFSFPNWFTISPKVMNEMEVFERKIIRNCVNMNFETRTKRYSNKKIYEAAKVTPLSSYLSEYTLKFAIRLEFHPNKLIQEVYNSEKVISLQNTYYPSPVNCINVDSAALFENVNDEIPQFYKKVTHSSNRG